MGFYPGLKLKIILYMYLGICILVQLKTATSSAPSGKGPWLLHWRLFTISHVGVATCGTLHVLRSLNSWTEAKRTDWLFLVISGLSPIQNILFFFFLPTFDVTRTTWPLLVVYHLFISGLLMDMPPMHALLQLCISLPACLFLDFQKTLTLSSSQQWGSSPSCAAAATPVSHAARCSHGAITCYALKQGLPMVLLGLAAATLICTVVQRSRGDARRDLALHGRQQAEGAGTACPAGDPDPAPSPAVPLESLGIPLLSALGLRPIFLVYHSCIMYLASRTRHVVLGAICLPVSSLYFLRTVVSRFESTPVQFSAEEILVLILSSYVVGRDSSKLDMSGFLHHVQSRLMASQALLVDMLPAHLVAHMLNSMEDTQLADGQRKQQSSQDGQAGRAQAAKSGSLSPPHAAAGAQPPAPAQRIKGAQNTRRRPQALRRAVSSRRPGQTSAEHVSGSVAEAETPSSARSQEGGAGPGMPSGPAAGLSRHGSFNSSLGLEDMVEEGGVDGVDGLVGEGGGGVKGLATEGEGRQGSFSGLDGLVQQGSGEGGSSLGRSSLGLEGLVQGERGRRGSALGLEGLVRQGSGGVGSGGGDSGGGGSPPGPAQEGRRRRGNSLALMQEGGGLVRQGSGGTGSPLGPEGLAQGGYRRRASSLALMQECSGGGGLVRQGSGGGSSPLGPGGLPVVQGGFRRRGSSLALVQEGSGGGGLVREGSGGSLGPDGLVQEGGPVTTAASPSHNLPPARRPSFYAAAALGRSLSSSLWTSLQSQLAAHALGTSMWRGGGRRSSSGTGTPPGQTQGAKEALSGRTTAASHECVTLFFSDLCGFSSWAGRLPPEMVMSTLDEFYSRLDDVILNEYPSLYKVETIGDAYIVAANLLTPDPDHAATAVRFALRAQQEAHKVLRPDRDDGETLEMRIGLHSGSIMSGIVGKIRRRFCLFGDTMNMAARTESSCPTGSIQLTAATYALAEPSLRGEVCLKERGEVQVKGSDKPLLMFLASAPLLHLQKSSLSLPDDQGG